MINLAPKVPASIHYLRWQAIQYADHWTTGGRNCNTKYYYCYESQGVDCANFVSQALYDPSSGGDLGWSDAWHPGTDPNYPGATYDFVNANGLHDWSLYRWAANSYGTTNYNSAWQWQNWWVYPGDLFFYDWNEDGWMDHTTIPDAMDANGNNFIDSHTADLNYWPWNLGYPSPTGYYFVVMSDYV
jgi:hypothetical protein